MFNKKKLIQDEELDYITNTSFYMGLQNNVCKLVDFIRPNYLIELGCGTGNTSIRIAKECPHTSIVAMDHNESRVNLTKTNAKLMRARNITYVTGDFMKLDNFNLANANLILMMYSFNFIADPSTNKKMFLQNLYKKLSKNAFVLIADTFLSNDEEITKRVFKDREFQANKFGFWKSLNSLNKDDIELAKSEALIYENKQKKIEKEVQERKTRCLVTKRFIENAATEIGFKVVVSEYVNGLHDGIVLLKK